MINLMLLVFPNPFPLLLLIPFSGWLMLRHPGDKRCEIWFLLNLIIAPLAFAVIHIAEWLTYLAPLKYDEYLYLVERYFGLPGWHMGRYLWDHPAMRSTVLIIYNVLPYELVVIVGMYLWKVSIPEAMRVLETQTLLYLMIFLLYIVYPAMGPNEVFRGFPYAVPDITVPHAILATGAPNCIPSGHFGTALLTLWFARRWKWGIILGSIFAAVTVVATLTVGGHYTLDLIAAIPYTALIIYLGEGCGFIWKLISPKCALPAPHARLVNDF